MHPRHKREVGERLAYRALYSSYGRSCVPSGPLYREAHRVGDSIRVYFDWSEGLHLLPGSDTGFEIAGADGLYRMARVRIQDNCVIVWHPDVSAPCAVRYAWKPFTRAGFVNGAMLPASTFRTEDVR